MTASGLLGEVTAALRDAGIPFMLTGSVASAYHGAGRATMDLDLVIDPDPIQLDAFVERMIGAGAYVSTEAAREALAHRQMFNVVDASSGWKADLIVRKLRPFSDVEFSRRQPIDFFGVPIDIATLEDVIISKLEWAKLGGSARQLDDVGALLRARSGEIDLGYVREWVEALGLREQWASVVAHGSRQDP